MMPAKRNQRSPKLSALPRVDWKTQLCYSGNSPQTAAETQCNPNQMSPGCFCGNWLVNSNIYMEEQRTTASHDAPEAYSVSHKSRFTIRAGCWCKDRKERLMEWNTKSKEGIKCRIKCRTVLQIREELFTVWFRTATYPHRQKNCILHYHVKSINYRLFKELKSRSIAINILKDAL